MTGFVVLPRRWVVERTFSWFGRNRRLAKDFENLTETLATFVTLAFHPAGPQAARQGVGSDDGGLQSIVKRPSPERPATTGTRRFRTFPSSLRNGEVRPEQRFCLFEIGHREAFGEPAVDRREKVAGFDVTSLVATQTGEAHDAAQFPELGPRGTVETMRLS